MLEMPNSAYSSIQIGATYLFGKNVCLPALVDVVQLALYAVFRSLQSYIRCSAKGICKDPDERHREGRFFLSACPRSRRLCPR
jgi:hypothetical protein